MHFHNLLSATMVVAVLSTSLVQAAVTLQLGPVTTLNGGLVARTITAVGTAGEVIAGFDGINIEGAHQVWGLGDAQTVRTGGFPGFGWDSTWEPYDTHLLVPQSAVLGSVGAALSETNSKSSTGLLGVAQQFGQDPPSGYGVLKSSNGTDGFRLLPALQSTSVPFIYLVTGEPVFLDVSVAYTSGGNNLAQKFTDFTMPHIFGRRPGVADLAPYTAGPLGDVVNLQPIDSAPGEPPVAWSVEFGGYAPGYGALPGYPGLGTATISMDPTTGAFQFNTLGATRGTYSFNGTASNAVGSDPFRITVDVVNGIDGLFPEPSTVTLLGLAVVGIGAGARRRS